MVPAADVVLRRATARDTDFAYQTRRAALAPYVAQDGGWDEVEEQRVHARRFAAHEYRIISVPGRAAGVIALEQRADCLQLHRLYLVPECQGKGIGRVCMERLMDEACARSVPVRLRVRTANVRPLLLRAARLHADGHHQHARVHGVGAMTWGIV
jgi:GNAT superfamily N-acetyltransferase